MIILKEEIQKNPGQKSIWPPIIILPLCQLPVFLVLIAKVSAIANVN